MITEDRSLHDLRRRARAAATRGDLEEARVALISAAGQAMAREEDYVAVAADLRDILSRLGDARGALTVDWYAGSEPSHRPLLADVPAVDRARTLLAWADRAGTSDRARGLYARAAGEYERAGLVAQAAIARERGGDHAGARALWSRLAQVLGARGSDLYAAGLARFNLARMAKRTGDRAAAREASVCAVHLLEEAADRYETIGQRERSFDCFQVLIAIGRDSSEFEHVLEGYVNVIRILREDHLRYDALQSYEDAVVAAEKQGEVSAAATLAREMAAYARKEGLVAVANHGMLVQARLWQTVAELSQQREAPAEIAENALLAAVIAFGEAGQYAQVGRVYDALGKLPLDDARTKQYQRARIRYVGAEDLKIDAVPLPAHLRAAVACPEVWHIDLVEWEQNGSASQACGEVVLDPASWSEATRRRAMLARLTALSLEEQLERRAGPADPAAVVGLHVELADQLARVELYAILSPLEHMMRRPEPQIRSAVVRALGRFLYKRTFISLREALDDPEPAVVDEAARALEEMRFPHAFDPLARIYRESQSTRARASAVRALARIDTVEAAELLLAVLEHDGRDERAAAVDALKRARGTKFVDLAMRGLPRLSKQAQATVRDVLAARGVPV